jgi:hypothetical protein
VARVDAPDIDDLREPDGVVTFVFDAPAAAEHARAWFREQAEEGRAPEDLPDTAALAMPTPIYLPFWTFDMTGEVRWSGWVRDDMEVAGLSVNNADSALRLAGGLLGLATGNVSLTAENLTGLAAQRLDRSNMVHTEGAVGVILDDILVPATRSLPEVTLRKLEYDTSKAVPYSEDMLARWPAEIYAVSLGDASLAAREEAIEESNRQIALESGIEPGSSSALMYDRTGLSVTSYKLLLLPVWTATYTYRSEQYHVLINGQSGQVEGEMPRGRSPLARLFGG